MHKRLKPVVELAEPCRATAHIDQFPDQLGLNYHQCELPRGHWGNHVCWCECAFANNGDIFERRPLAGYDQNWRPGRQYHELRLNSFDWMPPNRAG